MANCLNSSCVVIREEFVLTLDADLVCKLAEIDVAILPQPRSRQCFKDHLGGSPSFMVIASKCSCVCLQWVDE